MEIRGKLLFFLLLIVSTGVFLVDKMQLRHLCHERAIHTLNHKVSGSGGCMHSSSSLELYATTVYGS